MPQVQDQQRIRITRQNLTVGTCFLLRYLVSAFCSSGRSSLVYVQDTQPKTNNNNNKIKQTKQYYPKKKKNLKTQTAKTYRCVGARLILGPGKAFLGWSDVGGHEGGCCLRDEAGANAESGGREGDVAAANKKTRNLA